MRQVAGNILKQAAKIIMAKEGISRKGFLAMAGGMLGGWASLGAVRPKETPAGRQGRPGKPEPAMMRVQQAPKSVPYKSAATGDRQTASEE